MDIYLKTLSPGDKLLAIVTPTVDTAGIKAGEVAMALITRGAQSDLSDTSPDWKPFIKDEVEVADTKTKFEDAVSKMAVGDELIGIIKDVTEFDKDHPNAGDPGMFPEILASGAWVIGYGIKESSGSSFKYTPTGEYQTQKDEALALNLTTLETDMANKINSAIATSNANIATNKGLIATNKTAIDKLDTHWGNICHATDMIANMKKYDATQTYNGYFDGNVAGHDLVGFKAGYVMGNQVILTNIRPRPKLDNTGGIEVEDAGNLFFIADGTYVVERNTGEFKVEQRLFSFNIDKNSGRVYVNQGGSKHTGIKASGDRGAFDRVLLKNTDKYTDVQDQEVLTKKQVDAMVKQTDAPDEIEWDATGGDHLVDKGTGKNLSPADAGRMLTWRSSTNHINSGPLMYEEPTNTLYASSTVILSGAGDVLCNTIVINLAPTTLPTKLWGQITVATLNISTKTKTAHGLDPLNTKNIMLLK